MKYLNKFHGVFFSSDYPEAKRKVHNYQVFLSNTTRRQEGSLCIDDTGPIFPLPGVVKNCPALARFVIFHNAISHGSATTFHYSQICEVMVEGNPVFSLNFAEYIPVFL